MEEFEVTGQRPTQPADEPPDEPPDPDEPPESSEWEMVTAFLRDQWLWSVVLGLVLLSPVAYGLLAAAQPATALFVSSLLMVAAFITGTLAAWPMGSYITWNRRLEVLGYRLGTALLVYLAVGLGVTLLVNRVAPLLIPLEWPTSARFIPFWPFYTWVLMGCGVLGFLPCPPPPG